jgi:hypothetical protein
VAVDELVLDPYWCEERQNDINQDKHIDYVLCDIPGRVVSLFEEGQFEG